MRNPKSRNIDVSRARRVQRRPQVSSGPQAGTRPQPAAPRTSQPRPVGQQVRPAAESTPASARRPAGQQIPRPVQRPPVQRPAAAKPPQPAPKKKKVSPGRIVARVVAAMLCVTVLVVGGFYWYISHKLNAGNSSVTNDLAVETPPELTEDQMNILVVGLDYTESDSDDVQRSKENPQADMILYVQYDKKASSIKMLQIPRDVYVGPEFDADGTGKINGTFAHGPNKENKIQNLVEVINSMFQLSVDHWVTIDMESLREMVDVFGGGAGIPVNIPYDIIEYDQYGNVAYALYAGEHNLKGYDLEFFLRARKADGMNRGDIDRLDNQKIFYSALFNYMRTMSWQEMVKLMPFFLNYVETDISPIECAALGVSVMGVPNDNIIMGTLPVILNQSAYYTPSSQVVPVAAQQTADCLNEYFRPAEAPVDVSMLQIPSLNGITEPVVDCEMKHIGDNGTVADGAGAADASSAAADSASAATSTQTSPAA